MNYTAYTAVIFTFHHMSAALTLVLASIFSALVYWLFIKGRKYWHIALALTFFAALFAGAMLSEEVFQRTPISIEVVRAG